MVDDLWYKNTIIYSLDLETFMDANGDGIGGFEGLSGKLEYLHALGVGTIWLAPFQPTPNKDNGYDISDFYGVDRRHGSSGDFVDFIHKAKSLGIKVIIDLVVNHTSDQHPWFQDARSSKDSKFRDWYVWSKDKPANWNKGMVFPGVQKATWTLDKKAKEYYFHRFYNFQPDLNTDNPEVRAEIRKIMGFWLQLGIAGFRVDAVPFIIESRELTNKEPKLNFEYLMEMRRFLQWRSSEAILLGEANVLPEENKQYFGKEGQGINMMFNFYVNQYVFYALATADIAPLIKALKATKDVFPMSQWAQFLRNHDELDLGRLTDEERAKVFERFGPEPGMQLYERGIRRRLSSMLGSRHQIELAYSLLFSLPGTPVIRYGDEIGMGDNLELAEREAVRTPMQWSAEKGAGFTKSDAPLTPVIENGLYGYSHVNVEHQRRDPNSMLNWTSSMIRLRKECPEIGYGDWEIVKTGADHVLGMCYNWKGSSILAFHNFEDHPHEVVIDIKETGEERLIDLIKNEEIVVNEQQKHSIVIGAYRYRWFRTGNIDRLLR